MNAKPQGIICKILTEMVIRDGFDQKLKRIAWFCAGRNVQSRFFALQQVIDKERSVRNRIYYMFIGLEKV